MTRVLLAALAAALFAPAASAADPDPPPVAQRVSNLEADHLQLRKDVADLRAAVARIEAMVRPPSVAQVPVASASAVAPAPAVAAAPFAEGATSATTRATSAPPAVAVSTSLPATYPAGTGTFISASTTVRAGGTSNCPGGNCSTGFARSGPVRRILFGR